MSKQAGMPMNLLLSWSRWSLKLKKNTLVFYWKFFSQNDMYIHIRMICKQNATCKRSKPNKENSMLPKIEKILYTTTLSPKAPYIFSYAVSQAQHYQAQIYLLHVLEPLSSFAQNIMDQYISKEQKGKLEKDSLEWLQDKIKSRIQNFCEKETCNLEFKDPVQDIMVLHGQPAETIIETAKSINANLIVMGTHRKTFFSPGLLGSTTQKVIHSSQVPVLCVNTPKEFYDDLDHPVY